jgi:hypothetical protein
MIFAFPRIIIKKTKKILLQYFTFFNASQFSNFYFKSNVLKSFPFSNVFRDSELKILIAKVLYNDLNMFSPYNRKFVGGLTFSAHFDGSIIKN